MKVLYVPVEKFIEDMIDVHGCLSGKRFDFSNYIGRRDDEHHEGKFEEIARRVASVNGYVMNPFLHDLDKLEESKAIRRESFKSQFVVSSGLSCHKRTRRSHTGEVISISRKVSEILGLNTTLCEAIALGHDIGHTPYGHIGEYVLADITKRPFSHILNAINIAQHVERKGKGLNLTFECLYGMLNHSTKLRKEMFGGVYPHMEPLQEALVVMYADKIAYLTGDYNDIGRSPALVAKNLEMPKELDIIGHNQRQRQETLIYHLIRESSEKGYVSFEDSDAAMVYHDLKAHLTRHVHPHIDWRIHKDQIEGTYEAMEGIPELKDCNIAILVGCMTDNDVAQISVWLRDQDAITWGKLQDAHFGICEIAPYITKDIDQTKVNLDWGLDKMVQKYPDYKRPNMDFGYLRHEADTAVLVQRG